MKSISSIWKVGYLLIKVGSIFIKIKGKQKCCKKEDSNVL